MPKQPQPATPHPFRVTTSDDKKNAEINEVQEIADRICNGLAIPDLVAALHKTKDGRAKSKIAEEFVQLLLTAPPTSAMVKNANAHAVVRHKRDESRGGEEQKKWEDKIKTLHARLKGGAAKHADEIMTYLHKQRSAHADGCKFVWEMEIKDIGGPKVQDIEQYGQKIDVYSSENSGVLVEVERGGVLTNNHDFKDIWKCHLSGARHLILVVPIHNYAKNKTEPRDKPFQECKKRLKPFFSDPTKHLDIDSVFLVPYACDERSLRRAHTPA